MSILTASRKTSQYGTPPHVLPPLLNFTLAASAAIFAGGLVGVDASGDLHAADPAYASFAALKITGVAAKDVSNAGGAAGAKSGDVQPGAFFFDNGDGITKANIGQIVYASDDHTVNKSDAAGARPAAGYVVGPPDPKSGQIPVLVGMPWLFVTNPELGGGAQPFKARAVLTSVAAYTGAAGVLTANANGAIGAQDGVTLAVGDVVLLAEDKAAEAKDAGPYVVTALGGASAKFVLTRCDWWATGATLQQGSIIEIGGEGTLFGGSSWKCFAAAAKVVDTDAPVLWPSVVKATVTLVAGAYTLGAAEGLFLRSTTKSQVTITRNTANTSTATTGGYSAPVASRTAGVGGTGAVLVRAEVAAGTLNNADISTLDVVITNW